MATVKSALGVDVNFDLLKAQQEAALQKLNPTVTTAPKMPAQDLAGLTLEKLGMGLPTAQQPTVDPTYVEIPEPTDPVIPTKLSKGR